MSDTAQERYFKAEKLALESTLEYLDDMLANTDSKQAFRRTFDVGFSLGFLAAIAMNAQGFNIREVDTSVSALDL